MIQFQTQNWILSTVFLYIKRLTKILVWSNSFEFKTNIKPFPQFRPKKFSSRLAINTVWNIIFFMRRTTFSKKNIIKNENENHQKTRLNSIENVSQHEIRFVSQSRPQIAIGNVGRHSQWRHARIRLVVTHNRRTHAEIEKKKNKKQKFTLA